MICTLPFWTIERERNGNFGHAEGMAPLFPVTAGLAPSPEEWNASAAFYKARNISGLVDISPNSGQPETPTYLHCYTQTHEYFITGFDGKDNMFGKVKSNVYPT